MVNNKTNTSVPSKEVYSRMNFLYQASMLMAKSNTILASYYGRQCRQISQKAQLKITPNLKRDFCKRCYLAQQPCITTDLAVEHKPKRRKRKQKTNAEFNNIDKHTSILMKCRQCGYSRRFNVNPRYEFWLENEASVEEEITFSKTEKSELK